MSRDKILAAVAANQPESSPLPELETYGVKEFNIIAKFTEVAISIGSRVFEVENYDEIKEILRKDFVGKGRIVSVLPEFSDIAEVADLSETDPHQLDNVELAILKAHFGVAENSALWVTDDLLGQRVLPFIGQHLALLVQRSMIVPTMLQAYKKIALAEYNYATFIAGPSKTADIEQALVLGAHGPRSLTVLILN